MSGRPPSLDFEPVTFDDAPIDWEAVWADVLAWEPPSLESLDLERREPF